MIPVNVIYGGGSQELSEEVAAWIRTEKQVAKRAKVCECILHPCPTHA